MKFYDNSQVGAMCACVRACTRTLFLVCAAYCILKRLMLPSICNGVWPGTRRYAVLVFLPFVCLSICMESNANMTMCALDTRNSSMRDECITSSYLSLFFALNPVFSNVSSSWMGAVNHNATICINLKVLGQPNTQDKKKHLWNSVVHAIWVSFTQVLGYPSGSSTQQDDRIKSFLGMVSKIFFLCITYFQMLITATTENDL